MLLPPLIECVHTFFFFLMAMKKEAPRTLVFRAERTHLVSKNLFSTLQVYWNHCLLSLYVCFTGLLCSTSACLSLSLFCFFCFLAGGFCFGVFVIIWEQDHFLFRVCTAPMELQSVTENQDNGIIADDNSLRSNFCRGSNCCLSFLR